MTPSPVTNSTVSEAEAALAVLAHVQGTVPQSVTPTETPPIRATMEGSIAATAKSRETEKRDAITATV